MNRILYLCNGQKEDCKKRMCHTNGGDCKHTTDVKFAENFKKRNKSTETYWENETTQYCKMASVKVKMKYSEGIKELSKVLQEIERLRKSYPEIQIKVKLERD